MEDATLVSLQFDETVGPVIQDVDGPLHLSDSTRESIKLCAFPESVVPLANRCHVYTFAVDKVYCHCGYIKRQSEAAARGFDQFSFVIATKTGHNRKLTNLLASMNSILDMTSEEIGSSLASMLRLWKKMAEPQFPLFNGLLTAEDDATDTEIWRELKNENLEKIWQSMVLNEPVLVLGATPELTSRAVEALMSMVKGSVLCEAMPYISITDPRFAGLAASPKGVIGASNPMAAKLMKNGVHVVKVGFPRGASRSGNCLRCAPSSSARRTKLQENTKLLVSAIHETLRIMEKTEPGSLNARVINVTVLQKEIAEHHLPLGVSVTSFTDKLVSGSGFRRQYDKCLGSAQVNRSPRSSLRCA